MHSLLWRTRTDRLNQIPMQWLRMDHPQRESGPSSDKSAKGKGYRFLSMSERKSCKSILFNSKQDHLPLHQYINDITHYQQDGKDSPTTPCINSRVCRESIPSHTNTHTKHTRQTSEGVKPLGHHIILTIKLFYCNSRCPYVVD